MAEVKGLVRELIDQTTGQKMKWTIRGGKSWYGQAKDCGFEVYADQNLMRVSYPHGGSRLFTDYRGDEIIPIVEVLHETHALAPPLSDDQVAALALDCLKSKEAG